MRLREAVVAGVLAVGLLGGCTEDPLLDPSGPPGATSQTFEVVLNADELPEWRDSTFTGFAVPSDGSFSLVSNRDPGMARALARFNVPDTVTTFADTLPVESFEEADILVRIDTTRSALDSLPLTLRLVSLTSAFDPDSATWQQAASGDPWTTPGGDLGQQLSSTTLDAVSDTAVFQFDVSIDSLLAAWREDDGQPGVAIVVEGSTALVRVVSLTLRYEAILEGRTEPISAPAVPASARTFITDPPPPPVGAALRVGGLPASRFYFRFLLPDSINGFSTRDLQLNHAELILTPLAPPAAPYPLETDLIARPVQLLADPFVFGARTPVGGVSPQPTILRPDSLSAGSSIRVDVGRPLTAAVFGADEIEPVKVGLRADPDVQTLGFWEFASVEFPSQQPRLLLIVTPRPEFVLP